MNAAKFALLACISALSLSPASSQQPQHHHADEELGTVSFSTSCAPAVQSQFERGVALLVFLRVRSSRRPIRGSRQKRSALRHGLLGTSNDPLPPVSANRPSKADLAQGAQLLAKARSVNPPTARERDYILALSVFYSDTDKLNHNQRADAYAKAMQGVYERNPNDHEAAIFYALSLLASGPDRDPNLTNAKAAVAILNKLYDQQPNHPGIAHYIIHSCDNPAMASLTLSAARKYASIAPSFPSRRAHAFAHLRAPRTLAGRY